MAARGEPSYDAANSPKKRIRHKLAKQNNKNYGLGATSREKLFLFYHDVHACFLERNVKIAKVYVGEYATSLEMEETEYTI